MSLSFTPEADDEDKAIVCLAIHETLSTPMNVSRRLRLQYAPKVRVNLTVRDARGGGLREGSGAVLACEVDAKPMIPLRIRWFRNGTTTTFRSDSDVSCLDYDIDNMQILWILTICFSRQYNLLTCECRTTAYNTLAKRPISSVLAMHR